MPVSTATPPERSFSTMRRVETYLCSTMKTEQLTALVLIHMLTETYPLVHFVKYFIISCSIRNPGICQLIKRPDYTRSHLRVLEFSEFSGKACPLTPPQHVAPWALLMGANAPILYLPSICSTRQLTNKKMPGNAPILPINFSATGASLQKHLF